jgi:xylulose-5-phosphate/fructose-6-phosphate phosphoketolase
MTVLNELDRYHLALEAIAGLPDLTEKAPQAVSGLKAKLEAHRAFVQAHGEEMSVIQDWCWRRDD